MTTPVLLMGYLNSVERMGYREFVNRAAAAGIDGMVLVNLPPEEAGELLELMRARDLESDFPHRANDHTGAHRADRGAGRRFHLLRCVEGRDRCESFAH